MSDKFTTSENIEYVGNNPIKVEGSGLVLNGKPIKNGDIITLTNGDVLELGDKALGLSLSDSSIRIT